MNIRSTLASVTGCGQIAAATLSLFFCLACQDSVAVNDAHSAIEYRGVDAVATVDGVALPDVTFPREMPDWAAEIPMADTAPPSYCESNADCAEGFCVYTKDGQRCSPTCIEDCPQGWSCNLYPGGPDEVFVCIPKHITLCRPCDVADDCLEFGFQPDAICREFSPQTGSFCLTECSADAPCPDGYECGQPEGVGVDHQFCLPVAGDCDCDDVAVLRELTTTCLLESEHGACFGERRCTADGLTDCDALDPSPEECDGLDNDCDGSTDEGPILGEGELCDVPERAGACQTGKGECIDGTMVCQQTTQAATELCDSIDNDCDGETDEEGAQGCTTLFADFDEDGFGSLDNSKCLCEESPPYSSSNSGDCDDSSDLILPGADESCDGLDNDCDGVADPPGAIGCELFYDDADQDGYSSGKKSQCRCSSSTDYPTQELSDCDDKNAAVSPAAEEVCDGLDNDCDGTTDGDQLTEGCITPCGAGFQDCEDGVLTTCSAPPENSCTDFEDCSTYETCSSCLPQPAEVCNGVDDDCNGQVDDDDTNLVLPDCDIQLGICNGASKSKELCEAGKWNQCTAESYLQQSLFYEEYETSCDGLDNDCDGNTDEELGSTSCGVGVCENQVQNCVAGGLQDCSPLDAAEPEKCDGLDNDCDGEIDEELGTISCGKGTCLSTVQACAGGLLQACLPKDAASNEVCDGLDNDCDGMTDEDLGSTTCGKGVCANAVDACVDGKEYPCIPLEVASPEVCDGLDNNCDGQVDEGLGSTPCGKGACQHMVENCQEGKTVFCDPLEGQQVEVCNGLDDDCDGDTDEQLGTTTCGEGICQHTVANCEGAKPVVCNPLEGQQMEACDGLDNDCDGNTDDNLGSTTCGLGNCEHTVDNCFGGIPQACDPLQGTADETCDGSDNDCDGKTDEDLGTKTCGKGICLNVVDVCVDGKAQQCLPLEVESDEVCNGLDDDCDGDTDEELGNLSCGQGICSNTVAACIGGAAQICVPHDLAEDEECDGLDNDCDGEVDNGFQLDTDSSNCGQCGTNCAELPKVLSTECADGTCKLLECEAGFHDVDGISGNGCEYEAGTVWVDFWNIADPLEDGSQAHPFNAIEEGLAVADFGTTVMVLEGVYSGGLTIETESVSVLGAGAEAVFVTAPDGEASFLVKADGVKLSGMALSGGRVGIEFKNVVGGQAHDLVISDQNGAKNQDAAGINIENSDDITVSNVDVSNIDGGYGSDNCPGNAAPFAAGVLLRGSSGIEIEGLTVHELWGGIGGDGDWSYGDGDCCSGGAGGRVAGVMALNESEDVEIRRMVAYNLKGGTAGDKTYCGKYGANGLAIGLYVRESSTNIRMYSSLMFDLRPGTSSNGKTYYPSSCVFAGTDGMIAYDGNTCLGSGKSYQRGIWVFTKPDTPFGAVNSIFADLSDYCAYNEASHPKGSLVVSHSDFYDCSSNSYNTTIAGGCLYKDPEFVDVGSEDYHLKPSSPCLDAGKVDSPYCKEPEANGCRVNLGAYGNTSEATAKPGSNHCPCP